MNKLLTKAIYLALIGLFFSVFGLVVLLFMPLDKVYFIVSVLAAISFAACIVCINKT